ncbi:hypothetical protein D3C81_1994060 [compost metagenome]
MAVQQPIDEIIDDFDPVIMAVQHKILLEPLHNLRLRDTLMADQVIFAVEALQEHIVQPHPGLQRTLRFKVGQQPAQDNIFVLCV